MNEAEPLYLGGRVTHRISSGLFKIESNQQTVARLIEKEAGYRRISGLQTRTFAI